MQHPHIFDENCYTTLYYCQCYLTCKCIGSNKLYLSLSLSEYVEYVQSHILLSPQERPHEDILTLYTPSYNILISHWPSIQSDEHALRTWLAGAVKRTRTSGRGLHYKLEVYEMDGADSNFESDFVMKTGPISAMTWLTWCQDGGAQWRTVRWCNCMRAVYLLNYSSLPVHWSLSYCLRSARNRHPYIWHTQEIYTTLSS